MNEVPQFEIAIATRKSYYSRSNEDAYDYDEIAPGMVNVAVVDGMGTADDEPISWFSQALSNRAITDMALFDGPKRAIESVELFATSPSMGGGKNKAAILLAKLRRRSLRLAWKGDVSAWIFNVREPSCNLLTTPDHDASGAITHCIGDGDLKHISRAKRELKKGDMVLFATDGVRITKEALFDVSEKTLSAQGFANMLLDNYSLPDDATILAIRKL